MELIKLKQVIDDFFLNRGFEQGDYKDIEDEEYLLLSYMQKDFRIQASYDPEYEEYSITLDRPFYHLSKYNNTKNLEEISKTNEDFLKELEPLMAEDIKLLTLTTKDCELFLKTGSYDGMASGVIEHRGSLYYIESITNPYEKEKCQKDRDSNVWRHFYVFDLNKEELEQIIMKSLDWMRHINLTSLCKNWEGMYRIDIGTGEEDKKKHFDGKYQYQHKNVRPPVMKLTIHY